MAPRTHYDVLGVPPSATQAEVRAAYRAAARNHHPDAGGDPGSMRALNRVWAVLGDPVRRAAYDRTLRDATWRAGIDARATAAPHAGWPPAGDGGDHWPVDPDAPLTAEDWADLADGRPIAPTMALEGWWVILPPAMLVLAVALFVGAIVFGAPALIGFAAGAFVVAGGLFVLAPLRAMARRPRR